MIIQGDGYTFDTETRKIEFGTRVCSMCDGTGKNTNYISCPNSFKVVKNEPGRKCRHCGAKNRNSHKLLEDGNGNKLTKIVDCNFCEGGTDHIDFFSSLDFTPIVDYIEYVVLGHDQQTFNDAYIGIGNFGGVTGYTRGEYLTAQDCKERDLSRFKRTQAGNLVTPDGFVPDRMFVRVHNQGASFTSFMVGTRFGGVGR